jgi:hypothetical protein
MRMGESSNHSCCIALFVAVVLFGRHKGYADRTHAGITNNRYDVTTS